MICWIKISRIYGEEPFADLMPRCSRSIQFNHSVYTFLKYCNILNNKQDKNNSVRIWFLLWFWQFESPCMSSVTSGIILFLAFSGFRGMSFQISIDSKLKHTKWDFKIAKALEGPLRLINSAKSLFIPFGFF